MNKLTVLAACILALVSKGGAQDITLEAERALLSGAVSVQTYANENCVYMESGGSITFSVNVSTAGNHTLRIRAATPLGEKTQDLYVNNVHCGHVRFDAGPNWDDVDAGAVHLRSGQNSIEILKNWGWTYFDRITLRPAPPNDYRMTDSGLVNPDSDGKTRGLFAYLRSQYGRYIISGQASYWDQLLAVAGKSPAVRAFDFQTYTAGYPYLWDSAIGGHSFGWHDNGTTASAIDWYNSTGGKGIVSFQWHWHSPFGGKVSTNTFYAASTTFDVSKAVVSGTQEYTAVLRDIDSVATQLKRLQKAGVPVLWRPLHEAGGKWFWWGAKTARDCLALYDLLYDRLTNYHKLNNLIWVWSTPEKEWYPGNGKVDIIGYDSYPGNYVYGPQKAVFNLLYDMVQGRKMVAMTENGPMPDIDRCVEEDAMWLYFSSWSDEATKQNSNEHIKSVFAHKSVITLDEVPEPAAVGTVSQPAHGSPFRKPKGTVLSGDHGAARRSWGTLRVVDLTGRLLVERRSANTAHVPMDVRQLQRLVRCRWFAGAVALEEGGDLKF